MSHSKYLSPSSLHRRIPCPGSAFLEEGIEEGPKPAADWGSFAHHIGAECLIDPKNKPEMWMGKEMFGQVCDQEMVDCVKQYLADVEELKSLAPGGIISVEKKVSLEWAGYDDMFGTADISIDSLFDTLIIGDLKSGVEPVAPAHNPQAYSYALMTAGEALTTYNSIIIAISQPRGKQGGTSLSTHEIKPLELLQWFEHDLKPTIKGIRKGREFNELVPGEKQCKWCKATNICPAYTRMATQLASVDFADHAPTAPIINDELVNKVYPHLTVLKEWVKRVEGHAFDMAKAGSLNGFKLVGGRRSRKWKNAANAETLLKKHEIDPYEKKLLSPAKAEKALGKEKKILKELITVSDGNPVIAPEDDKRKAISTAAMDFAQ